MFPQGHGGSKIGVWGYFCEFHGMGLTLGGLGELAMEKRPHDSGVSAPLWLSHLYERDLRFGLVSIVAAVLDVVDHLGERIDLVVIFTCRKA